MSKRATAGDPGPASSGLRSLRRGKKALNRPRVSASRASAIVTAAVCLTFLVAASCGADDGGIEVGEARRANVVEVVDAPASVAARGAATLTAAADGTLSALHVKAGDEVRAGQVLGVVDSPEAQARLAQAKQALDATGRSTAIRPVDLSGLQHATDAAAAAAFAAAREAAGKIQDPAVRAVLLSQVVAAERRYGQAAAAAAQAIRGVQRGIAAVGTAIGALGAAQKLQAQQAYDLAKSTVDALTLRAPIGGIVQIGGVPAGSSAGVGSFTDLLGAVVGGGSAPGPAAPNPPGVSDAPAAGARLTAGTPVLTIVDVSELTLVAEVDETDILLVHPGVTASVELDAATGARYAATVRAVDVLPTTSTRGGVAYRVRLALGAGRYGDDRAAPVPRPGMSAVAHLHVREAIDTVAVPAAAVFTVDGQDSVWAVRDGKARRIPVTVGVPGQDLIQITGGLEPGQRIVIRGADRIREGDGISARD